MTSFPRFRTFAKALFCRLSCYSRIAYLMNGLFSFSTLFAFLLALGVLVAWHELGHYAVARYYGVRVLRYCLGFGPIIWKYQARPDATEWAIAIIPLGGYVSLLGQDTGETVPPELSALSFATKSVWRRFAIVAAGPIANLLLAVALYMVLHLHGVEEPDSIIANPPPGSVLAKAGVEAGDRLVSMDDRSIDSWQQMVFVLLDVYGQNRDIPISVQRTHPTATFSEDRSQPSPIELNLPLSQLSPVDIVSAENQIAQIGFNLYRPAPKIVEVADNSPALQGGLRVGDVLLRVDGKPILSARQFVEHIRSSDGRALRVDVARGVSQVSLDITPQKIEQGGNMRMSILAYIDDRPSGVVVKYGFFESIEQSVRKTWDTSWLTLKMIGRMLIGDLSWRNLSGPVTIADYAGRTVRLGWTYYLGFLAMVSISLGVLNLLPIPMLDGGYLVYYCLEAVRGRPLSERIMQFGMQMGLSVLLVSMVLALYNDISRLLGS